MAYSFIDETNLQDAFEESKTYMRPLWEGFDEYERLADNKPHPSIASHLPKVTEGTLASTIIKQPRRVIQQLPTGKVMSAQDAMRAAVVDYVWQEQILRNANTNGTVLQKAWASTSKALTYGSQPAYVFFTQRGDYFGADFRLPYAKHVYLESGQVAGDCNVQFMEDWYTPNQIQQIIDREVKLKKFADERGEKYKSIFNLKKLAQLKDTESQKDAEQQNPDERKRGGDSGGIRVIKAFQTGIKSKFYYIAPDLDFSVIGVEENPDPRGIIPIHYQFHTVDMNNPLGRGAPEHSGGAQNLLDGMLQSFQYTQALSLSPPQKKYGESIIEESIRMVPDAIWDMGNDPNSKLEPVNITNNAIQNFPQNFGLIKGIILTGASGQDSSISAESGNAGFSKTNAGVKQQSAILGVDDNYIRKQFESWFEDVSETMINIHFAKNAGHKEFVIGGQSLERLVKHIPELKDNGGKYDLVYKDIRDSFKNGIKYEVDATTSKGDDNDQQIEIISGITEEITKNPVLLERMEAEGYEINLGEAFLKKIIKSGVEDPEKIVRKKDEEEIAKEQAEAEALAMEEDYQGQPEVQMPNGEQASEDLEGQVVAGLRQAGMNDEQIGQFLGLLDSGMPANEALRSIA